jgi:spore germination cell wall hydrolase CwlJ-like protein
MVLAAGVVGFPVYKLQQRVEVLQNKLDGIGKVAARAKADAAASNASGARLDGKLKKANAERDTLESQVDEATSRIEHLSDDLEKAEASLRDRRVHLASVQNQVDDVKQKAAQAEARASGVDKKVASLESKLDEGSTTRDGLRAELQSSHTNLEQLHTQLEISRSRLSKIRARLTRMEETLEGSKQTAKEAKTAAAALKNEATALKSQLEAGKAARDVLRDELDQANAQIEKLKDASLRMPPFAPEVDQTMLGAACKARDYLARTIAFEGSGETEIGKIAIAYVVLNRESSGRWGDSIKDVVTSPWQFEPWMTRRKAMEKLSRKDPRYKDAVRVADAVLMGEVSDPTGGATHFLNPVIVRKRRGGTLPSWAQGDGKPIGRHVFYAQNTDHAQHDQKGIGRLQPTALYHHASQASDAG